MPCWMWPTQFMSKAFRRISLPMPASSHTPPLPRSGGGWRLWEQPAHRLGAAHLLHPDRHRRRAVRNIVPLDTSHDLSEGAVQHVVQLAHYLGFVPEELLEVLHPFEITDHDAAGIAQHIR